MVKIIVFGKEDLKKSGGFKVKNNSLTFESEETFLDYVKSNNLKATTHYIDISASLSNNKMFKCWYNGFICGTTDLVNKINGGD